MVKQLKNKKLDESIEKKEKYKKKIDIKQFERDLMKFKPVKVKNNFKKLEEQECFIEDDNQPNPENELLEEKNDQEIFGKKIEEQIFQEDEKIEPKILENPEIEENEFKENDDHIREILARYEKTIGKIKETSPKSIKQTPIPEKRSKSSYSHYSTASQQVAYKKLKKLQDKEEKIKKEKEELIKFLDSRRQLKGSSRPVTVASLYSKRENNTNIFSPLKNVGNKTALPELLRTNKKNLINPKKQESDSHNRRHSNNEVKDLITSLF